MFSILLLRSAGNTDGIYTGPAIRSHLHATLLKDAWRRSCQTIEVRRVTEVAEYRRVSCMVLVAAPQERLETKCVRVHERIRSSHDFWIWVDSVFRQLSLYNILLSYLHTFGVSNASRTRVDHTVVLYVSRLALGMSCVRKSVKSYGSIFTSDTSYRQVLNPQRPYFQMLRSLHTPFVYLLLH